MAVRKFYTTIILMMLHLPTRFPEEPYKVIVGDAGVNLAKEIDELDSKIRDLSSELRIKKKEIEAKVPAGVDFNDFLKLKKDETIDDKVGAKKKEIESLEQASVIKNKPAPSKLEYFELPSNFSIVLGKTIADVSSDAESLLKEHLLKHNNRLGDNWLSQGFKLAVKDECPYCGQSTSGISLVKAYEAIFSEAYKNLLGEISGIEKKLNHSLASVSRSENISNGNSLLLEYWSQYIEFEHPTINYSDIKDIFNKIISLSIEILTVKSKSPLGKIDIPPDFEKYLSQYENAKEEVQKYNQAIESIEKHIIQKKSSIASSNIVTLKTELITYNAVKERHIERTSADCDEYLRMSAEKDAFTTEKAKKKEELTSYSQGIFQKYQKQINILLENFDAEFRLFNAQENYVGGKASTSFQLVINNTPFDVGDSKSPSNKPSFKNTLSSGDKSTLALAFFIAQLNLDPNEKDKIVLFDDPFSSQDRFRRNYTRQLILRQLEKVKQVFVFSHDSSFLLEIVNSSDKSKTKSLQLLRNGESTVIREYNIHSDNQTLYHKYHETLSLYVRDGASNLLEIIKCVRPMLEDWLRFANIAQFKETEWLGDMIKKIRECDTMSPIDSLKTILADLDDINDYTCKYHHGTGVITDASQIDDGELKSYVKRSLKLVKG